MNTPNVWWGSQYAHGIALRVLALGAKLVFLLVVVTNLPDSTYSRYLYFLTIAVMIARITSLGAEEHLPTLVRNDIESAQRFFQLFAIVFGVSLAALALHALSGNFIALIAFIVASLTSGWLLGGVVRSIRPQLYERLINFPMIIFVIICIVFRITSFDTLLLLYALSGLVVQAAIALAFHEVAGLQLGGVMRAIPELTRSIMPGIGKTASNILLLLNIRAVVVLPAFILGVTVSDAVALAVSAGEAVWQLGMVICMRNYASYCRGEGTLRRAAATSGILFAGFALVALALLVLPLPPVVAKVDWVLIGWSILFFAGLMVFMELRYFFWAREKHSRRIFAIQGVFFLLQCVATVFLAREFLFPAFALGISLMALFAIAVLLCSRSTA